MTAMARLSRIALDFTLVSMRTVRPVVSNWWMTAKNSVEQTKARPLMFNPLVNMAETVLDKITNTIVSSLTAIRNRQLLKEQVYLEKELEKVKDRISKKDDSSTSKSLKPILGTVWQYAKTEVVPPMTLNLLHGPIGKKLEDSVSKIAEGFITGIENRIKDIEAEKARAIKRKLAEAKAAQEKIKAEAKRKAEEARKKEEVMLAKQAKKKEEEKLAKEAKAKEAEAKKTESAKPAAKPQKKPKKTPPKKNK